MKEYVRILVDTDHCTTGHIYEVVEKYENDLMIINDFDFECYLAYSSLEFVDKEKKLK